MTIFKFLHTITIMIFFKKVLYSIKKVNNCLLNIRSKNRIMRNKRADSAVKGGLKFCLGVNINKLI